MTNLTRITSFQLSRDVFDTYFPAFLTSAAVAMFPSFCVANYDDDAINDHLLKCLPLLLNSRLKLDIHLLLCTLLKWRFTLLQAKDKNLNEITWNQREKSYSLNIVFVKIVSKLPTLWKFQTFPANQILREINFETVEI